MHAFVWLNNLKQMYKAELEALRGTWVIEVKV